MPELPEVETIVRGLNKVVIGTRIIDIWTDWPRHFSRHCGGFEQFKKQVKGLRIKKIKRIGKNIIFELSSDRNILLHLKMTGRLLLVETINLSKSDFDNIDHYIHTVFCLSEGKSLAFSDVRKFGKILSEHKDDFYEISDIKKLGKDALTINYEEFKKVLSNKKIPIKYILLNQKVIAGIGNIYADEILFLSGVHPLRMVKSLSEKELKKIYDSIRIILIKAIKLRGSSMSDYKDIKGKLGNYFQVRLIYRRGGESCLKCKTKISRIKLRGRSMHFCKNCQK
ncbi:MAG: DNA-formamidopyrimidine glycosylase [bacterium]|nr:DNA-formamidopyrimidine glycosylase [bacterium]